MAGKFFKPCNGKSNAGSGNTWLLVWDDDFGIRHDETTGSRDSDFWIELMNWASDSCWEESPGSRSWNNVLSGGRRGCMNDVFGKLLATELDRSVGDSTLEASGGQIHCLFGKLTVLATTDVDK